MKQLHRRRMKERERKGNKKERRKFIRYLHREIKQN
jgi:hypothetical protein